MEGRFDLGNVALQSGDVLTEAFISYETHGELNADRSADLLQLQQVQLTSPCCWTLASDWSCS